MPYTEILIAVDGSEYSVAAAKRGFELAHQLGARTYMVFVVDKSKVMANPDAGIMPGQVLIVLKKEAQQTLDELRRMYNDSQLQNLYPPAIPVKRCKNGGSVGSGSDCNGHPRTHRTKTDFDRECSGKRGKTFQHSCNGRSIETIVLKRRLRLKVGVIRNSPARPTYCVLDFLSVTPARYFQFRTLERFPYLHSRHENQPLTSIAVLKYIQSRMLSTNCLFSKRLRLDQTRA